MSLTPSQIEQHTFGIVADGYDRDEVSKFLLQVAAAVRLAMHSTTPPTTTRATTRVRAAAPNSEADDKVGQIIRAAHTASRVIRQQAAKDGATEAGVIRRAAEYEAKAIIKHAEADAASHHDRAKRKLTTAQYQADALVAEAEQQARAIVDSARERGTDHTREVAARARDHAEEILRAERDALIRLHDAQARLANTIEMLGGSASRPVLDLTDNKPAVRLGDLAVDMTGDAPDESTADHDPIVRMVRAAVHRAAEHSGTSRGANEERVDSAFDAIDLTVDEGVGASAIS